MAPGNSCIYVDENGKENSALVIHRHQATINLVYVSPDAEKDSDSFGNERLKATSVPPYEDGMSGHYFYTAGQEQKRKG